jgi:hypothetical protein
VSPNRVEDVEESLYRIEIVLAKVAMEKPNGWDVLIMSAIGAFIAQVVWHWIN